MSDTEIAVKRPKRKVLSLKKEPAPDQPPKTTQPPRYLNDDFCVYMVWCDGGDMPKRVYQSSERNMAVGHAKALAETTKQRFYVMRSWRGFDPKPEVETPIA